MTNPTNAALAELKPCPFCGVAPRLHYETQGSRHYFEIWCDKCDFSAHDFPRVEDTIAAWNTRAAERFRTLSAPVDISREFHEATEALLDWMNNNDLAWDHANQRQEEFQRLCDALDAHKAALREGSASPARDEGLREKIALATAFLGTWYAWHGDPKPWWDALGPAHQQLAVNAIDAVLALLKGEG